MPEQSSISVTNHQTITLLGPWLQKHGPVQGWQHAIRQRPSEVEQGDRATRASPLKCHGIILEECHIWVSKIHENP